MKGNVDLGLPERLSARRGDRHYDPRAEEMSGRLDVYLDGRLLGEIVSYDTEKGEVVRQCRDSEGRPILRGEKPKFEALQGLVEVRWIHSEVSRA